MKAKHTSDEWFMCKYTVEKWNYLQRSGKYYYTMNRCRTTVWSKMVGFYIGRNDGRIKETRFCCTFLPLSLELGHKMINHNVYNGLWVNRRQRGRWKRKERGRERKLCRSPFLCHFVSPENIMEFWHYLYVTCIADLSLSLLSLSVGMHQTTD